MTIYLDEERVRALLHQPVRNMLTIEEGKRYLGSTPAVAEDAMGLKLVSFYPGNAGTRVPTHLAMILLCRPDTGEPLAVMDSRLSTEMRTAAVSAPVHQESGVTGKPGADDARSGVQAKAHLLVYEASPARAGA